MKIKLELFGASRELSDKDFFFFFFEIKTSILAYERVLIYSAT